MGYVIEGWFVDGEKQQQVRGHENDPQTVNVWRISDCPKGLKNGFITPQDGAKFIADFADEARARAYLIWLESAPQPGAVTVDQAAEALDSMDDFARMANVDAIGPRGVLERFIAQAKSGATKPGFNVFVQVMEESHRTTYWTTIERTDRPKNAAPWEPGRVHPFLSENREHAEHEATEWADVLGVEFKEGDVRPIPKDQSDYLLTALASVRGAIGNYHLALDRREHGGVAAGSALDVIQAALNTPWVQDAALKASVQ